VPTYSIEFDKSAARELAKLPRRVQLQVRDRIDALANNPRPPGVETLQGELRGLLRIRSGDYRVVYSVEDPPHDEDQADQDQRRAGEPDANPQGAGEAATRPEGAGR